MKTYNKLKALRDNIAAIFAALCPDCDKTAEHLEAMRKFTGFGGLKELLCKPDEIKDEKLRDEFAKLRSIPDFENMEQSLKSSVLTAFYTPKYIVDTIGKAIREYKPNMQTFLDPCAGTGAWLSCATEDCNTMVIEKDLITWLILKHVGGYKELKNINGFEGLSMECKYDVIASNIPFGSTRVFDPHLPNDTVHQTAMSKIHNFFFVKAMDLLNDGGILCFLTTRAVADTPGNQFVREYLVKNANLLCAMRLPDHIFMESSGIEVGTDVLIFQKNESKVGMSDMERLFLTSSSKGGAEPTNDVFTLPGTVMATLSTIKKDQYGKLKWYHKWHGNDETLASYMADVLRKAMPSKVKATPTSAAPTYVPPKHTPRTPTFSLFPIEKPTKTNQPTESKPRYNMIDDYALVKDSYIALTEYETKYHCAANDLRDRLNEVYDTFVERYGYLHEHTDVLLNEPIDQEVLTIEIKIKSGKYAKADIMREPTAFAIAKEISVEDGLSCSMNLYNRVDLKYIESLTGKDEQEIIDGLTGKIYYNPMHSCWEHESVWISGNVVQKAKETRTAIANMNEDNKFMGYAVTAAEALEMAIPQPIPYEELDFNLGERWIPDTIYSEFASDLLGTSVTVKYYSAKDTYTVAVHGWSPRIYDQYAYKVRGKKNYNGDELLRHALQDTIPDIKKEIYIESKGEYVSVPDEEAQQQCGTIIQTIREKFVEWLDESPAHIRNSLTRLYNNLFNCKVPAKFDGSYQTFPGLTFDNFPYKELYPSQKDCIAMIKQNGGGICWHEVGAGKTMVMCVASYELKRIGMCHKPLIIALKANVHEIADTYRKAYPHAKLLYPTNSDFSEANRIEFFRKIKNNNWDCIIMTHDQFGRLPQSDDVVKKIVCDELNDIEECLDCMSEDKGITKQALRGLQIRRDNLLARLAELNHKISKRKDEVLDFRTMGIDHIFVDECHYFKNLMVQTRHTRVAGLGDTHGSQRASNLLYAIRDIQERTGRDLGATFLSGTVVVNAMTELYCMFKYLRPNALQEQAITCFDAWLAIFTQKSYDYELNITGSIRRKERFRTYIKLPELTAFLKEITDYRTADMINLDIPRKNLRFVTTEPTYEQREMLKRVIEFASSGNWSSLGLNTPCPTNLDKAKMLVATDIARKIALDPRLLSNQFTDDMQNKASVCAREVYKYYQMFEANKGTQFIFSDLGTYNKDKWNIYDDIKDKLIELGIPAHEIKFIHQAKSESARKQLFDDMNAGRVRVIFGSTLMLGTGVNAQQRAVAVHHLDIPWRPADLEQRNGRAVRKGNTVKLWGGNNVDIVIYGTEQTLDAYKFNLLRNKQLFINQINSGTLASRKVTEDEMDENSGMNYAEFVAILSGNNDLLAKAKLDAKIMLLEKEQGQHKKQRYQAEKKLADNEQALATNDKHLRGHYGDQKYITEYKGNTALHIEGMEKDVKEATPKDIGKAIHNIYRDYRGPGKDIGTYMGMNIMVKSRYKDLKPGQQTPEFDTNVFYLCPPSGIKYRCTVSMSHEKTALEFTQSAIAQIDKLIKDTEANNKKLEDENVVLREVVGSKWKKTDELNALKQERAELQRKIDEELKGKEVA